jgi:protoporphyrin/coproporphyrin ferrochelatase
MSKAVLFGCNSKTEKIGVLLTQTGTPDAPTPKALRKYLAEFLWDPRVIEVNRVLWWLILNGIVLRTRPKRSARLYSRIWTDKGSPLMYLTKSLSEKLHTLIQAEFPDVQVTFGMRYGSNNLSDAFDALVAKGCTRILVFPLYPHYSATTTASSLDVVFKQALKKRWIPSIKVAEPYYINDLFIKALSSSINSSITKLSFKPEKLLLSYHGVPARYIKNGDPYCCMCTATTQLTLPHLNYSKDNVLQCYQSRFGKEPWLEPYADELVTKLAKEGVKKIAVVCPGFSIDCLETIDEIGHELKQTFIEAGGEELHYIPSLNDSDEWVSNMKQIVIDELGPWLQFAKNTKCGFACPAGLECR